MLVYNKDFKTTCLMNHVDMVFFIVGKTKFGQVKKRRNREYHVQKYEDVDHQNVSMYCTANQFLPLSFCVLHNKPHGGHELGKNYIMCFDTKLGHSTCKISHIPCACTQCT